VSVLDHTSLRPIVQRRALALLLLGVAGVSVWMLLVSPVTWLIASQDEWRAQVRAELSHSKGRAALEPMLRKQLESLPTAAVWSALYTVAGETDADALVQRDLMALGVSSGVTVQVVTPLPKVEVAELTGHGVRFTVSTTADHLRSFAGALRGNPRYLRVERLAITAPQIQAVDENPQLTVTMDVYGYSRSPATRGTGQQEVDSASVAQAGRT
jgi:Tfp pilus assembly protein PilO